MGAGIAADPHCTVAFKSVAGCPVTGIAVSSKSQAILPAPPEQAAS